MLYYYNSSCAASDKRHGITSSLFSSGKLGKDRSADFGGPSHKGWNPPPACIFCILKFIKLSLSCGQCKSVCLSVCPHDLYFRTHSNGRYIRSLQMIFVRSIQPLRTLYTETYHTTRQIYSHIIHPRRHRTMVPCRKRILPYTVFFPYHTVNTYRTTYRCFPHIPYHQHIPYPIPCLFHMAYQAV